jgi:hypothetical protein
MPSDHAIGHYGSSNFAVFTDSLTFDAAVVRKTGTQPREPGKRFQARPPKGVALHPGVCRARARKAPVSTVKP